MDLSNAMLGIVFPYSVAMIIIMSFIWRLDGASAKSARATRISWRRGLLNRFLKLLLILFIAVTLFMILFSDFKTELAHLNTWFLSLLKTAPNMQAIAEMTIWTKMHITLLLCIVSIMTTSHFFRSLESNN